MQSEDHKERMELVTLTHFAKKDFFKSKAWKIQTRILDSLNEPKTFSEICEMIRKDFHIRKPKSSAFYALTKLIERGEAKGVIDYKTLKKTKSRLRPMFAKTGFMAIFHGDPKERTNGSDFSIMRAYKDDKGNLVAKQFFKTVPKKSGGQYYRKISPVLPMNETTKS